MKFDVQLISYEAYDSWVENIILELRDCLHWDTCPDHDQVLDLKVTSMEYAELFDGM